MAHQFCCPELMSLFFFLERLRRSAPLGLWDLIEACAHRGPSPIQGWAPRAGLPSKTLSDRSSRTPRFSPLGHYSAFGSPPIGKLRKAILMESLSGLLTLLLGTTLILPLEWWRRKRYRRDRFLRNLRMALGDCPTCQRALAD